MSNVGQRINLGGGFFLQYADQPATNEQLLDREVRMLRQRLEEVQRAPTLTAIVLGVNEKTVVVDAGNNQTAECPKPTGSELKVGDEVKVVQNGGIVGVVENPIAMGMIATVKQIIDDRVAEVSVGPQTIAVPYRDKPRAGDRVILNRTNAVAVKNIGAGDTSRNVTEETGVEWDDIGGQDDAKRALREAIEEPHTKKDVYARFGMRPPRGVLLYGGPGNGKTMLGKAAATALARLHGTTMSASGFIYVKGPELLDKFVGESESNIRKVFAQAREHHARAGYPAVVFIDECDAILGKRGLRAPGFEGIERTVIPQFLSEMDGMFASAAFVLLATNRPDVLDGAVVRDGRIDRKVHVKRPSQTDAADILARLLAKRPIEGTPADLARAAAREVYDGKHALYMLRCKGGQDKRFTLGDLASGAILAGLVERATQRAIRRAIAGADGGISRADLTDSVTELLREQRDLDHTAELDAFKEPFADSVVKVEKAERDKPLIVLPNGVLQ